MVFRLQDAYSVTELESIVSELIQTFNSTVLPKARPHFPRDLMVADNVFQSLLDLLSDKLLPTVHTVC
jgi:hypothetical protein